MLDGLLLLGALLLALPFTVLGIECWAALRYRKCDIAAKHPRTAVLIPAHDEEAQIAQTLRRVRSQLQEDDRIVVVAGL